eukprot:9385167-Lingulodinium_polyedra.AAC.1
MQGRAGEIALPRRKGANATNSNSTVAAIIAVPAPRIAIGHARARPLPSLQPFQSRVVSELHPRVVT